MKSGGCTVGRRDVREREPARNAARLVRSVVAIVSTRSGGSPPARARLQALPDWQPTHLISADRRAELAFTDARASAEVRPFSAGGKLTLVVGDDAEWDETRGNSGMASAACVEWDPMRSSLDVLSSIVGLPPIFIYREPGAVAVASELRLLRAITRRRVDVDPQAAAQLFTVGYPLEHRTLFKDVTLMPGGHSLRVDAAGRDELAASWEPPAPRPWADQSSYIGLQAEAFRHAVSKLRLSNSFFSLTGGLDTRAILAVLTHAGIKLRACTLSGGRTPCLDARQAQALCSAYGLPHIVVALGEQFLKHLPSYAVEASRLSGGLASVEQAHEVYFYKQLQGLESRRLSGNLGNQIGRRGVERVSRRGADPRVLHDTIRAAAAAEPSEHWLVSTTRRSGHMLVRSLIQSEVPFSSVANYSIGHHFMIQQSPYANRLLIETSLEAAPASNESQIFMPGRARLRQLAHRFVGQRRTQSFQRRVIEAAGGAVAELPINWGWRARGGVSLHGLGCGLLAFTDSVASQPRLWAPARRIAHSVGADGVGEITQYRTWFDTVLREFVNDTLRSRLVTGSGLFNTTAIVRLSDEHYRGIRSHYETLLATLDLALAQQLFTASS
jgi:hypothetical protein